jgi:hypothetical protein
MHKLHTLRTGDISCLCAVYISTFCIGLVQIFRCAARDVLPLRSDRSQSHPTLAKVSRRGWRSSAMAESVGRQVSHASLEHQLRSVRSAIRALREAAETARGIRARCSSWDAPRGTRRTRPNCERRSPTWAQIRTRGRPSTPQVARTRAVELHDRAAAWKQLECKSPSQVTPKRGSISRETAGLLRNPARNRA